MNQTEIGSFIASCRREKNMTQEQLAEKLGVSNKSISRWENGKTMMDISMYQPICDYLGITINELLAGKKLNLKENEMQNEKNMFSVAITKRELEILHVLSNILFACGILITMTLGKLIGSNLKEHAVVVIIGVIVWAIAILIKYRTEKALREICL